jgi:hypothetical protein
MSEVLDTAIRAQMLATASLTALVGNRIFLGTAPQGTTRPCVVFYRGGGGPLQAIDGPVGTSVPLYDITSIGETIGSARQVAAAVAVALDGWRCASPVIDQCTLDNQEDGPDEPVDDSEEGLKTVVQTYEIWTES